MSRIRSLAVVGLSAAAVLAAVSLAQPPAPPAPGVAPPARQPGGRAGGQQQSLEQVMNGINRSYDALGRTIEDAKVKTENLTLVARLQSGLALAKSMPPAGLSDEENAAFRKMGLAALKKAIELEEAIVDGKTDEAKKLYAAVATMRDEGHKKFKVKEPPAPGGQ